MTDKKQYYKLDDIRCIGDQKKLTKAEIKEDNDVMAKYIKAIRSGKPVSSVRKKK
ncbi:MAG: hypothetical protein ABI480_06660 [Chitinophagaceae bacterium]